MALFGRVIAVAPVVGSITIYSFISLAAIVTGSVSGAGLLMHEDPEPG